MSRLVGACAYLNAKGDVVRACLLVGSHALLRQTARFQAKQEQPKSFRKTGLDVQGRQKYPNPFSEAKTVAKTIFLPKLKPLFRRKLAEKGKLKPRTSNHSFGFGHGEGKGYSPVSPDVSLQVLTCGQGVFGSCSRLLGIF